MVKVYYTGNTYITIIIQKMDNNRQLIGTSVKLESRQINLLEERGENISEYLRNLINKEEFKETLLLEKNERDLKKIEQRNKIITKLKKLKEIELSKLQVNEISFLVDCKRKIDNSPNIINYLIKSYKKLFNKKVNKEQFIELIKDTFKKYPKAKPFIDNRT